MARLRNNYSVRVTETRYASGFPTLKAARDWLARKHILAAWVIVDRHGRIMKGKA